MLFWVTLFNLFIFYQQQFQFITSILFYSPADSICICLIIIIISNMEQKIQPQSQKFFQKYLALNGQKLFPMESTHIMILYFILNGLNSLGHCQMIDKNTIKEYIKSLYLVNKGGYSCSSLYRNFGDQSKLNIPHVVFTYSALNCLSIVGGLEEINKKQILESVRRCKKQDGSFSNFQTSSEADLRFVYAALSICNILQDFSIIDRQKTQGYIHKCFNFDGGYGLRPYCQSHSGAIYCAVASMNHLKTKIDNAKTKRTLQFLVNRQTVHEQHESLIGVQGRVGKLPDSCYSFWVGASIKMLTGQNLLNENIQNFLMICYDEKTCGFSKFPHINSDPVHTHHSNMGMKILKGQMSVEELAQGVKLNHKN